MTKPQRKAAEQTAPQPETTAAEPATAAAAAAPADAAQLEAELARVRTERDTYLDHLQRLQAEFENYRKRVQREADLQRKTAAENVVESLLPVIDSMYRACQAVERHDRGRVVEGVEMVTGHLCGVLGTHGLEEIAVEVGDTFDPTVHEAVMVQPSGDHEHGVVVSVVDRGYRLHGKLLRPARVVVAG